MRPNFCMLYYRENIDLTEYRTRGHAHYKLKISREKTLITHKKLKYFIITPRL
jgi:hypothetical protein